MKKLTPLLALAVGLALALPTAVSAQTKFSVFEATIPEMRAAMEQGKVTSRELVTQYLTRIALYEDKLHAALTVNPKALEEADALDRERAAGHIRGPLHGIPVAVKDNVHTTDMPTTGGALAFEGFIPPYEATLVTNLKAAGAIILAKTTLTELANWVAGAPMPMPANYNAVGRYGYNPYDPGAIRAMPLMTAVPRSRPVVRVRARARRRISGRPMWGRKLRDRF